MQAAQIRTFYPFHSPFPFLSVLLAPKNGTYLTGFSGFFWEMNAPLCTNTATLIYLLGTIRSSRVFHFSNRKMCRAEKLLQLNYG